jgi:hypothetical protein
MGWVVNATPRPLYPRERPGTHYIGGWVGIDIRKLIITDMITAFNPLCNGM